MSVNIAGVLKDGTGRPVQNCTIRFKAKRTSATVVMNTLASENPDEAGRYSIDMEPGEYDVMLAVEGCPPAHAGRIVVCADSKPGTLNDFLGVVSENDLRPEALRHFEAMTDEVIRLAGETAINRDQSVQSASAAWKSAQAASTAAGTAAKNAAQLAANGAAEQFRQDVEDDVSRAEAAAKDAEKYRDEAQDCADNLTVSDASTMQKGIVQLSSDTDNSSEVLAATPRAVKAAMDEAEAGLKKRQNGSDILDRDLFVRNAGAVRAFSGSVDIGGDDGAWTTAEFIAWLEKQGAFRHSEWVCRGSTFFSNNKIITDTGCGDICLAGAVVEVMGISVAMTIRVTTATKNDGKGVPSAQFTYVNNGPSGLPGWRRDYNTINKPEGGGYSKAESDERYQQKNTGEADVNGWLRDASTGIIRQWGSTASSGATLSVAFPVTFPNAALNVQISPHTNYSYVTPKCGVVTYDKYGLTLQVEGNYKLLWEATGY